MFLFVRQMLPQGPEFGIGRSSAQRNGNDDEIALRTPVDEVKDIKVEATYLSGARVYARPAGQ